MLSLGKWRWPVLVSLPLGILATCYAAGVLKVVYEAQVTLAPLDSSAKGQQPKRLSAQDRTPARAIAGAQLAADSFLRESVAKQKATVREHKTKLEKRKASLASTLDVLLRNRRGTPKSAPAAPSPSGNLQEMKNRRFLLMERFPNHPDIQTLGKQIEAMESSRRSRAGQNASLASNLAKKINETQAEMRLVSIKVRELTGLEKSLKPRWKVIQPAHAPNRPVRIAGAAPTAAAALGILVLGFFLTRRKTVPAVDGVFHIRKSAPKASAPIELGLFASVSVDKAPAEENVLPDDPLSRKAAALYDRWLEVVQRVYKPTTEPPGEVFQSAEPLLKETVEFAADGHDVLARHIARKVSPGDLPSHVVRTVLMAVLGACEAGIKGEHQQGMAFAALFHDLAVVPRPAENWSEIGTEVGRISSDLVRKIPGLPQSLAAMVEAMLVSMDEHALDVWQNVPRDPAMEPFANLLRQIDRFDKVAQKQKSRLVRRITSRQAA